MSVGEVGKGRRQVRDGSGGWLGRIVSRRQVLFPITDGAPLARDNAFNSNQILIDRHDSMYIPVAAGDEIADAKSRRWPAEVSLRVGAVYFHSQFLFAAGDFPLYGEFASIMVARDVEVAGGHQGIPLSIRRAKSVPS